MKKFYSYMILAVVTMFSFVACQTDDTTTSNAPVTEQMTFTAIAQSSETPATEGTRAELNGRETWWNSDDKIYIYDGSAVNEFTIATENTFEGASQEAVFSGKAAQNDSYIAVFGQSNWTVEDGVISNVTIPAEQVAVEGSFDDNALVAAAYTTENTLAFKNLCSLIKFTVGAANVTTVTVSANNGTTALAGSGAINNISTEPTLTLEGTASTITLSGTFTKGATYHIVVPATTVEGGINIKFGSDVVMSTTADITLKAGAILNLGEIGATSTCVIKGSAWNEWGNDVPLYYNRPQNGTRLAVLRNVAGGTEFKFVKGSTWIGGSATATANTWINCSDWASDNIKVPASGTYDIYLNDVTMFFCIVPAGEAVPVQPTVLLLKPNSNWNQASARFAAYFFENGEKWISMNRNVDGYYSVVAPTGFPKVIFCRMNPGATANNWNNKWNQTADLTVPKDNKIFFKLPSTNWDNFSNSYWSATR